MWINQMFLIFSALTNNLRVVLVSVFCWMQVSLFVTCTKKRCGRRTRKSVGEQKMPQSGDKISRGFVSRNDTQCPREYYTQCVIYSVRKQANTAQRYAKCKQPPCKHSLTFVRCISLIITDRIEWLICAILRLFHFHADYFIALRHAFADTSNLLNILRV